MLDLTINGFLDFEFFFFVGVLVHEILTKLGPTFKNIWSPQVTFKLP